MTIAASARTATASPQQARPSVMTVRVRMLTGSTLSAAIYRQLIVESRLETHQRPYPTPKPGLIEYLPMSCFTTNPGAYARAGTLFSLHTCRFPIERPSACGAPHRFLKHHLVFLGPAPKLFRTLPLLTRGPRVSDDI